ncbi:MAG: pantetheine-phosphate adenylyltransferase [Proteobacteria bacterium]|nr:pantetheine-phosphate adenylyltransferase [Pseudomonadota bacterium]
MTTAIYAGSFDPLTNGHVSVVRGGLVAFKRITVAVARNPKKTPLFSVEERLAMLREELGSEPRTRIDDFDGLLVDYAREQGVRVVLRGLRAVADFEHEWQMANVNRHMYPELETVFIMATDYFYVSSSFVKEAASLGGDVQGMVPQGVARRLRSKFGR